MKRRDVLKNMSLATGAIALNKKVLGAATDKKLFEGSTITHSVCRWCYRDIPLEVFCEAVQDMGIKSVEITKPEEWKTMKKYDLACGMGTESFASITKGWNDPENHKHLQDSYSGLIPKAMEYGVPNLIVFSGNRNGMDDMVGLENCARGLDPLVKEAEKAGIKIVMELLNSKVNHEDYMCDHTEWGVALCEKIGSSHFKLLYDIYHMQIMEGDVIATIRKYNDYIAHYHTGGVPGRNEIDETQELYYPAIIKAIKETGFVGYLAQEFVPAREDKLASLRQGMEICTV